MQDNTDNRISSTVDYARSPGNTTRISSLSKLKANGGVNCEAPWRVERDSESKSTDKRQLSLTSESHQRRHRAFTDKDGHH